MKNKLLIPNYKIGRLSNDVTYVYVEKLGSGLLLVGAYGYAGSILENNKKTYGVAHFLEHIAYGATKSFPSKESLQENFHYYGALANASTGRLTKEFWIETGIDKKDDATKYIVECICAPHIIETDVERERKVIIEEIKRSLANKNRTHGMNVFKSVTDHDRLTQADNMGSIESVSLIEISDLIDFQKKFYNPKNFIFYICGDITEHDAISIMEKNLALYDTGKEQFLSKIPIKNISDKYVYSLEGITQSFVSMVWSLPDTATAKEELSIRIGIMILGGVSRNRIYKRLREDLGYVYDVSMSVSGEEDPLKIIRFDSSTSESNVSSLIDESLDIIQKFVEDGPTKNELERAINQLIFRIKRSVLNEKQFLDLVVSMTRFSTHKITAQEYVEISETMTIQDVHNAVKNILSQNPTIIITNPKII